MASQDLQWLLVRNNSSFIVKQKGLGRIFSREPRNLVQLHSYKVRFTTPTSSPHQTWSISAKNQSTTPQPPCTVTHHLEPLRLVQMLLQSHVPVTDRFMTSHRYHHHHQRLRQNRTPTTEVDIGTFGKSVRAGSEGFSISVT